MWRYRYMYFAWCLIMVHAHLGAQDARNYIKWQPRITSICAFQLHVHTKLGNTSALQMCLKFSDETCWEMAFVSKAGSSVFTLLACFEDLASSSARSRSRATSRVWPLPRPPCPRRFHRLANKRARRSSG